MFSSSFESGKIRLFQTIGALSQALIELIHIFCSLSKEEKLYVMKRIVLTTLVPKNVSKQQDDENTSCYLTNPKDILDYQFIRLIDRQIGYS
jgi:hypothetical protein